jgi:D-3-phosphoglycerate dehydrogenase
VPLIESTKRLISAELLNESAKPGLVLVNTSRAGLVEEQDILDAIENGKLGGYLTDVLGVEPMVESCRLKNKPRVLITPHIGSRTQETIQRQGKMSVINLIKMIKNEY